MGIIRLHGALARSTYRGIVWLKAIARALLPRRIWAALRSALGPWTSSPAIGGRLAEEWRIARKQASGTRTSLAFPSGINLIGYLRAAKGISEAARGNLLALQAAGIPYSAIDYEVDIPAYQQTEELPRGVNRQGFKYRGNLIHINPPLLPYLWSAYGRHELAGRPNIGVWYWELPDFPADYAFAYDLVDEIWVGSRFVWDSVSARSPVPVTLIPPCVSVALDDRLRRADYNLPADCFLFLCAYDVLSVQARKNPMGAVEAFKRAFSPNDQSVGLVIKVNNAREDPIAMEGLRRRLDGYTNCHFIERALSRLAMNSLINLVDAYISLHRSEGFGLIAAEAMYLGKPVVMTRWSGNVDFMTDENSCGVDSRLIPVGGAAGPYAPDQLWADPDLDQAAAYLKRLRGDPEYCASISRNASMTVRTGFSPEAVGGLMRKRFTELGLLG